MDEYSEDAFRLLRPDYLKLMLTYQKIEDYLFQCSQGYLSFCKTDPKIMKGLPWSSMSELARYFSWYVKSRHEDEEKAEAFIKRVKAASRTRNYYVHEIFAHLYLEGLDSNEKMIEEKYREIDDKLMDDLIEAESLYEDLLEKYGPHPKEKFRKLSLSDDSISYTSAAIPKEQMGEEYAQSRIDSFPDLYWNLLRGYTLLEASLFYAVSRINEVYPFLDEEISESFHSKSYGEYRKILTRAVNKNPMVKMVVDDCLPSLGPFLHRLSSLQTDRNYWIHFCLGHDVYKDGFEDFLSSPTRYNQANQSYAYLQKCFDEAMRFEEAVHKRLPENK